MTNQELLTTLEATHAVVASGIIALREIIKHEASFTNEAKESAQAKIKEQIGLGEVLADALPDYRKFAPKREA